jgi:hypothetical protein
MARHRQWFLLAVAVALQSLDGSNGSGAEGAPDEWLRGELQGEEFRLHGQVFESDGSQATGFDVSGELNALRGKAPLATVVDGNRFEAWIPVNRLRPYSLWLTATAKDGSRLAIHKLNAFELRQAAIEGIRLTLQAPTRQIEVKVLADGKPVVGATVKAEVSFGVSVRATTDDDGIARLGLLADQTLEGLMAWTEERVGGFSFHRKPTRDPAANQHVIELSPCRDQTLRFVDVSGAPVAGLDFVTQIATPDPDYNFIGVNEHSRMTTNSEGEAVHRWFPDWETLHFYVDLESADWIGGEDPKFVDGVFLFELTRAQQRRRVRMALEGAEVAGLYVVVESFQGERENHSDMLSAWTDDGGRYTVDVLPDAAYCAYVLDARWVSPMVDVVPYDSASELTTSPELVVSEGQEVEVLVTASAESKPYPHLSVGFFREHSYTWQEDGEVRHGTGSAQWWATTDVSGRAVTRTLAGDLRVSIYTPLWRTEESIDVVPGERATLRLHCDIE